MNKTLGKSGKEYDDGRHVIFVNAAVDDGSDVAEMMQYFKKADPNDMSRGDLSKRVHYNESLIIQAVRRRRLRNFHVCDA